MLIMNPPDYLDSAKVIKWAWSGSKPFGIIEDTEGGSEEVFGIAICQYDDSATIYRFSCNKNWEVIQDGVYDSVEKAIAFLPEQYRNVERVWQIKN